MNLLARIDAQAESSTGFISQLQVDDIEKERRSDYRPHQEEDSDAHGDHTERAVESTGILF